MLLKIDALLNLWFSTYSLPGRFPLVVPKDVLLQLLSGVDVGSTVEPLMLDFVLERCSQGGEEFSARQCREAVGYLGKAFVRRRINPDVFDDPLFLGTSDVQNSLYIHN